MPRKHHSQFANHEQGWATGFVRKHGVERAWGQGSGHFFDRCTDRHFTFEDAVETLRTGLVIEVHNMVGEWRALVRSKNGTCVVISLESFKVITVYYNDPEDKHDTLNHKLYHTGRSLDIVELIKHLLKNVR